MAKLVAPLHVAAVSNPYCLSYDSAEAIWIRKIADRNIDVKKLRTCFLVVLKELSNVVELCVV